MTRHSDSAAHLALQLATCAACALACSLEAAQPPAPDPMVKENATVKVSDHVYVIPDNSVPLVPNVGIIVGRTATLVVDTGLGPRNGETILREVAKVSKNASLYVVSTHFHPEHALGEPAFPSTTKVIRTQAQQKDIDEFGLAMAQQFSTRSALTKQLLDGVQFRRADIFFDRDYTLDLGGVRAHLVWLGPTHTRGDTGIFVEGDRVLFSGDVVMNHAFLAFASPYASISAWLDSLNRLDALHPVRIVPSHGNMGNASLIELDRAYLTAVQTRARELKGQGQSVEEATKTITAELQSKYADWTAPARISGAVGVAYKKAR
jgi:glyoxylase-like metal-dependent hydrolase (beta-lactamase superfamily II)